MTPSYVHSLKKFCAKNHLLMMTFKFIQVTFFVSILGNFYMNESLKLSEREFTWGMMENTLKLKGHNFIFICSKSHTGSYTLHTYSCSSSHINLKLNEEKKFS